MKRLMHQPTSCALLISVLLVACGGQPSRPSEPSRGADSGKPTVKMVKRATPPQKRGGAYYKDDGPGDEVPENLDQIPDAQPRAEPLHRFANRPYVVLGKAYEPHSVLKPYQERGIASWYGKKFHGQKTSIGEPYDMFAMTAAHPTLAIPSYARVTNLSNGKTVVVRVIDRGPFHADRIIDMSYAAAHRLGYVDNGSAQVQVEAIVPDGVTALSYAQVAPPRQPRSTVTSGESDEIQLLAARLEQTEAGKTPTSGVTPAGGRGIYLQLGAFSNSDNAESLRSHLARELDWLTEGIQVNANNGIHRVHLGPYGTRVDAEKVAEKIRLALGYKPAVTNR
ncbi:MAG TPA: septal ring lytic transglycosylase RlpA family protein [Accumulibacter sp.]|nr:septal ring lytic transglycosylase RlpA family protein [Accumulibacter sp.]HMW16702.1 septal ring lytic transglycosylase RlpA family protein [Accumulibacter sp.]HMX21490.1 septal ring lytic transglycosylase RlpA family protein [Accumulibacter sp.]HMY05655.1 septal ring lytic transglycosylase RlpA family protein [Accumulibacter sp.]HNC18098.1 septal ring lytic transglycosylase RlpA family protein [Accumulibacter sp.]